MESDYLAALGLKCSGGALDQLIFFSPGAQQGLADDWIHEGWGFGFLICVSGP